MQPDVIIVGGGSAGCVLAGRLATQSKLNVLLLEAGPSDWNPVYRVPVLTGKLAGARMNNWRHPVEPNPCLAGRSLVWAQGRVLGGSSALNGMVWLRGLPGDYDRWAAQTSAEWCASRIGRVFDGLERPANTDINGLRVPVSRHGSSDPVNDAFFAAASQAGFPLVKDLNASPYEGVGRLSCNVESGTRWSAARSFLAPLKNRSNLRIVTRALVTRILFENGAACGVRAHIRGKDLDIRAREVVISAGTVNSPALLLRSGIGDREMLRALGIATVRELPGVGRNLQDHLLVRIGNTSSKPIELHVFSHVERAAAALLRAFLVGRGPAAWSPFSAGFLLRSSPEVAEPDLGGIFLPALSTVQLRGPRLSRSIEGHGYSCAVYPLRPKSRGSITLRAADPSVPPIVNAGYLSEPADLELTRRGVRLVRNIFAQPAFDAYRNAEILPGAQVQTDAEIDAWIGRAGAAGHHFAGSCAMGPVDDPTAVVDAHLRVSGVPGLRVADASIMPQITSSNTNAPAMMIGAQCATFLIGELGLQSAEVNIR